MSKKWFTRLTRIVSGTLGTAKEDIFSLEASLTKFERFVHFWVLVMRSFVRNRCPVRASALSYTTLLALIPMLAVAMSITSVFLKSEGEERIKQFVEQFADRLIPSAPTAELSPARAAANTPVAGTLEAELNAITAAASNKFDAVQLDPARFRAEWASQDGEADRSTNLLNGTAATNLPGDTNQVAEVAKAGVVQAKKNAASEAANYIHQFAQKSFSGTLGVTGMIFLLLTAILTLTRVEETFNDIWGVTRGRDWWSRITNYFFTIALGPVLIIAALGLANGPNFQKTRDLLGLVPFLAPLLSTYLPVFMICLTFAVFYKLVPNTKVDFGAALVGGTLAGLAWHSYNHLGFLLASRALKASAIYGGLAMIPLLMGGLYVVWLTVLFGAQVAYAFQNRASYLQDRLVENVNQRGREFVALRLMTCIGQRFNRGLPAATIREISAELGIPGQLAQQVMRTLLAAHLVVEVNGTAANAYAPARPLDAINCHHILLAMRASHGQEPATRDEPVRIEVLGEFARIQAAEEQAAASVSMLAMVNRAHARLELAAATASPNTDTRSGVVAAAEAADSAETAPPSVSFAEAAESTVELKAEGKERPEPKPRAKKSAPPKSISASAPTVSNPENENESFPL